MRKTGNLQLCLFVPPQLFYATRVTEDVHFIENDYQKIQKP